MITASELAGFFAAHAIWCVSEMTGEGDALIPMLAYTTDQDEKKMERLAFDDLKTAVEQGRKRMELNDMDATDAVLLYDARINVEAGKPDAIVIEMRCELWPDAKAVIAIPYTPKSSGRFLVHKPKLLAWDHCDDFDLDAAFEAFFRGVDAHEKGRDIWNAALDESK